MRVVEAKDRVALSRGVQGLASGLARVVNRTTGCSGQLWRDRYHARPLKTPTEVRRTLVYVLPNGLKHGVTPLALDPLSSAAWFDARPASGAHRHRARDTGHDPAPRDGLARPRRRRDSPG